MSFYFLKIFIFLLKIYKYIKTPMVVLVVKYSDISKYYCTSSLV